MSIPCTSGRIPCKNRSIRSSIRQFVSGADNGGALVEMALAMPIMMMMLTGIFTFSQALYQKLQLAEAVSNGGRVMAAERGATDPCADTTTAIQNAAPGLAKTSITISYNIDGNPYGTSCKTAGGANNPLMPAGTTAQVLATYPCTLSVYGIKTLTCSIGSQVTEAVQ